MPDSPRIDRKVRPENVAAVLAVLLQCGGDAAFVHHVAALADSRRRSERAWHSGFTGSALDDGSQLLRVAYTRRGFDTEALVVADVTIARGGERRIEAVTMEWIRWRPGTERDPVNVPATLFDEERDDIDDLVDGWIDDTADRRAEVGHG